MRKQRVRATSGAGASRTNPKGSCAVCGMTDTRALVEIDLAEQARVTLCASHELMYRRSGLKARTARELRSEFADRRGTDRRGGPGEVDELAEALTAAFTRDRRGADRRAS